jgi:hypothetical protein
MMNDVLAEARTWNEGNEGSEGKDESKESTFHFVEYDK